MHGSDQHTQPESPKAAASTATLRRLWPLLAVVAGMAAVFLAVQGKSMGGHEMPSDYAQDLCKLLGYRDVGGVAADADSAEAESSTELWVTEVREYGHLDFQIH